MKQWIDKEGWQIVEMSDQELTTRLICAGDQVQVITARGDWIDAKALSGIEQGDRYPVVWVERSTDGLRIQQPIETVNGEPCIRHRLT